MILIQMNFDLGYNSTSQIVSITQNLPAQNPNWTPEDVGLGNVPTFAIRQQYYSGDTTDRFILLLMERHVQIKFFCC